MSPWRTIGLTLAYDGTAYRGWQSQSDGTGLQDLLERALLDLTGETIRVTGAGRTDAGVHALGQLVSFHTRSVIPPRGFRHGLQHRLPPDVIIREAYERPYGYSARFDARSKRYRYVIHHSSTPDPCLRRYVWWHRGPLDLASMIAATQALVGTHDFRAFQSQGTPKDTTVRTVSEARWWTTTAWAPWRCESVPSLPPVSQSGDPSSTLPGHHALPLVPGPFPEERFLIFDIQADGFLYNMVRAIVGTLVHIGRGRWPAGECAAILASRDRTRAGDTAPAHGLSLIAVDAPIDFERITARLARYHARQTAELSTATPAADIKTVTGCDPPIPDAAHPDLLNADDAADYGRDFDEPSFNE